METISKFQEDVNSIKKSKGRAVEVSEETYYHFLEAVPPIYFNRGFACGEAYSHNSHGTPVYYCFMDDVRGCFGVLETIAGAEDVFSNLTTA